MNEWSPDILSLSPQFHPSFCSRKEGKVILLTPLRASVLSFRHPTHVLFILNVRFPRSLFLSPYYNISQIDLLFSLEFVDAPKKNKNKRSTDIGNHSSKILVVVTNGWRRTYFCLSFFFVRPKKRRFVTF